jgi:hypothetical protein
MVIKVWLFTLLLHSLAFSCSCVSSGCPGLGGKTSKVFVGTVIEVTDIPFTSEVAFLSGRKARIQVNEPLGGLPPETKEINVLTGRGGGDCGVPFKAGEQYLIDASVGADGEAHAGICSATRRIEVAGAALGILRQRRDGQNVPSLAGQIAQIDRNFDGSLGTRAPKPLANALVRVKAGGRTYQAEADSEGLYAFYNLPSGRYEFAPDLPAGTTLSWFIGSDKPLAPFDLRAGTCQERNVEVFASGSVEGRILDSANEPLPQAFVYIVPAEEGALPKAQQMYGEFQDKKGFFKFVHIPPGKYLIVVNPDDSRKPDFPYLRTFYPNAHERASAGIVTLGGGEQLTGVDIHLDKPFAQRHLKVRVAWANGLVIQDFVSVRAKGTANPAVTADAKRRDLKAGLLELTVLPEERYEVEAELTCVYSSNGVRGPGATLRSNKSYLVPGDDQTELLLTMPGTGCPEIAGKERVTFR